MDPFSQKNFQKISSMGLTPQKHLSKCHIGGDTGGGTPTTGGLRGYATPYNVDNFIPPPHVS
jgi:hypothetical protein